MSKVRIKMNSNQYKVSQLMVGTFILLLLLSVFGYVEWKWVGIHFIISFVLFIAFNEYQVSKGNYKDIKKQKH